MRLVFIQNHCVGLLVGMVELLIFKHLLVLFLQRPQIRCSVSCCLSLSRIGFFFNFILHSYVLFT